MRNVKLEWTRFLDGDVSSGGGYDYDKDARLRAAGRVPEREGSGFDECWIARLCWVDQFGREDWFEVDEVPPSEGLMCERHYRELMPRKGEAQH